MQSTMTGDLEGCTYHVSADTETKKTDVGQDPRWGN